MLTQITNLLFPVLCQSCSSIISLKNKYAICDDCLERIQILGNPGCAYCGKPVSYEGLKCDDCKNQSSKIDIIYTLFFYEDIVKTLIINFKFRNKRFLSKYFADISYAVFKKNFMKLKIDLIIPVPLHKKRLDERGYNQSYLIGKKLASKLKTSISTNNLIRITDTLPQYELNKTERSKNLKNAFKVRKSVSDKNILLIDDVATTGSTLQNCAETLKKAGAAKIYAFVIAHGK